MLDSHAYDARSVTPRAYGARPASSKFSNRAHHLFAAAYRGMQIASPHDHPEGIRIPHAKFQIRRYAQNWPCIRNKKQTDVSILYIYNADKGDLISLVFQLDKTN